MIQFIEKEPWKNPSPFTGQTYAPNYMVKDGIEYFVKNRIVHGTGDTGFEKQAVNMSGDKLEAAKAFLTRNGGQYFKFHGIYDDPFEMLEEMAARGHTFRDPEDLFDDCRGIEGYGAGFVDFHGNRNEVSAAFHYRIYDMEMAERIKEALKPFL